MVVGKDLLVSEEEGREGGREMRRRARRPAADGGNPLAASPSDAGLAQGYGLACQVVTVNYARDGWVHAYCTREEFVRMAAERRGGDADPAFAGRMGYSNKPKKAAAHATRAIL